MGGVALVSFKLWTHNTDAQAALAEFPHVDLRVSGSADGGEFMRQWYFGDLRFRLNPANWLKGGWRFLNAELGGFGTAALLLWGWFRSGNPLGQVWMVGGLVTTMVFTHLVLVHSHYYLMFSPAVALLCGVTVARLEKDLNRGLTTSGGVVLVATAVMLLSTIQGLVGMKISLDADPYRGRVREIIRQHTSPEDKLLIQGGGWGGELLFLSERRGLSIWNTDFLEKPANLARIRELGFNRLVMISESPMLLALQQSNPGQANQKRDHYEQHQSPVVKGWKPIFQSDDVLIAEIPAATGK